MYKKHSISVIIPCHNEEAGILQTYKKIPKIVDEVIVVDNLSTDKTSAIARKLGTKVVLEKNKGYGAAIKKGIKSAKGDLVVTIDGDGTYPTEDSIGAIDFLLSKNLDFVSCNRFPLKNINSMHWQNFLGNKLISFLMSLLFFRKFKDGLSGMWIFRKNIYPFLPELSSGWNLSEEIKIEASMHPKIKFDEYSINYHSRLGASKVWPLKVGLENIFYLFYLRFFRKR